MGKLKFLLLMMAIMFCCHSKAAWRIVYDIKTTAQVTANATAQKMIEDQHNQRLDSIKSKQERIMKYTATMATIKDLYILSMQNISGFGEESKMYIEMFNTTVDIFKNIPIAIKTLNKFPGKNHLLCLNEIQNLILETEQCVAAFKDIVNNGKIKSPLPKNKYMPENGGGRYKMGQGDGYNVLDRYQRYSMANGILSSLIDIKYRLEAIVYMCQFCNNFSNLMFNIDVDSWLSFFTIKNAAEGLINDWKGL